jgi:tRNA (guanine37-N1)-methyltransferase
MKISLISVFPQLYDSFLGTSLMKRASEKGLIDVQASSFFSYVEPKERIDAPAFGPGAGMLLRPEVVQKAIEDHEGRRGKALRVFFSPHGKLLDQHLLTSLAERAQAAGHLMLIAGRYEGMDVRVEEHFADEIVSVGNCVLMGGDLPAMMLLEGLLRLVPGVVGKQESVTCDSFFGPFVDYPSYTEPLVWQGKEVPAIVRSGNHGAIEQWRQEQAVERSLAGHFAWTRSSELDARAMKVFKKLLPKHYMVLMHDEIDLGEDKVGTTSITSIDIHDGARSARTYGVEQFYLVTPLVDQQMIAKTLLDFWVKGAGVTYNPHRHDAVSRVRMSTSLCETIAAIEEREGVRPLVIATSAKSVEGVRSLDYYSQGEVWSQHRPVLLVFGTGKGLARSAFDQVDYVLGPVQGFSDFNHLSVRSAMAVVLDRWFGYNPKMIPGAKK